ncbi:MAG: sulfite exporter TauE/SafE family protein [Bacteroidia bacterium]
MSMDLILLAAGLFLVIATLYSSIGHAGASGYLAVMALLSFPTDSIKPISLVLNIVVAGIAAFRFIRAGYFDLRVFLSFAVASLPMAYIAGAMKLDAHYFKLGAGVFLILSGVVMLLKGYLQPATEEKRRMPLLAALPIGAVVGWISGLIGVGGGIFLSPILILARWTSVKEAGGVSALFILVNSISGLLGNRASLSLLDGSMAWWVAAVVVGGLVGSYLGTKRYGNRVILGCLFLVLVSAGIKFLVA